MKKYLITVYWNHGFVHTYEVLSNVPGSSVDPVVAAKEHLRSAPDVVRYTVQEEDGNIIYEKELYYDQITTAPANQEGC